jgi:hypothetical protein
MDFWIQFDKFNPLADEIPPYPFSYLPDIAWRAKQILKKRTEKQIKALAESIAWRFEEYFKKLECDAIIKLRKEKGWNIDDEGKVYFEPKSIDAEYGVIDPDKPPKNLVYGGKHPVDSERYQYWFYVDFADIPRESNANEVDTLKECVDYWDDICKIPEVDDGESYELFAVLSLWLLDDVLKGFDSIGGQSDELSNLTDKLFSSLGIKRYSVPTSISCAGECALKAMDAVCYAEHLREIERLKASHKLDIDETHSDYLKAQALKEEVECQQRKERSEQLNEQRHKKRNEAKALVIAEWIKQPDKFPSGEQAGRFRMAAYLRQAASRF